MKNLWGAIEKGDFIMARNLLSMLPKPWTDEMKLVHAILLLQEGEHQTAMNLLSSLENQFEQGGYLHMAWLMALAEAEFKMGKLNEALKTAEPLLKLASIAKNDFFETHALYRQGIVNIARGRFDLSLNYLTDGLAKVDKHKYPYVYGLLVNGLGFCYYQMGNYDKSLVFYRRAREFFMSTGQTKPYLGTMINCANILLAKGDMKQALDEYKQIAVESYRTGFKQGLFLATASIGSIYLKLGQFDLALLQYSVALKLSIPLDNRVDISQVYEEMAEIYYYRGNYGLALVLCDKSLQTRKDVGNPQLVAQSLFLSGLIQHKLKRDIKDIIRQLHKEWMKTPLEAIRTMELGLMVLWQKANKPELEELGRLVHSKQVPMSLRLKVIEILVNFTLDQIVQEGKVLIKDLIEVVSIIDHYLQYAEEQSSVFHKLIGLLMKAKLYVIQREVGLAEITIELAESLVQQFGISALKDTIEDLRTWLLNDVGINDFHPRIIAELGIEQDLTFIYPNMVPLQHFPLSFIVTNEHDIEILSVPLYGTPETNMFLSGLLFALKLIRSAQMDLDVDTIELVDYSILCRHANKLSFWLIFKGKPSAAYRERFFSLVDQLKKNEWLDKMKDRTLVDTSEAGGLIRFIQNRLKSSSELSN